MKQSLLIQMMSNPIGAHHGRKTPAARGIDSPAAAAAATTAAAAAATAAAAADPAVVAFLTKTFSGVADPDSIAAAFANDGFTTMALVRKLNEATLVRGHVAFAILLGQ
jgi:hypothetical protein